MSQLRAPFPWFGGKWRAAPVVWQALGNPSNYVEPFAGALGVLLGRPQPFTGTETVNDADGFLCNLWRAIAAQPDEVVWWADWPVSECDLSARHLWLVQHRAALTERLQVDPDYCDPKMAGWWLWGICSWIGTGWCSGEGPWTSDDGEHWTNGNAGRGINRQLPHLGNAGRGIAALLAPLSERLRQVRIACGDWSRVVTPTVLRGDGLHERGCTAVVLDPPYADGHEAEEGLYAAGGGADVWHEAAKWAVENGHDKRLRIVLCGYQGTWTPPGDWYEVAWAGRACGYVKDKAETKRERLWLSPHCIPPGQLGLFGGSR